MNDRTVQRRNLLLGLGAGIGSVLASGILTGECQAAQKQDQSVWKYAELDPKKVAKAVYDFYEEGSCMYAVIRGVLSQLEELLRKTDPLEAEKIRNFPFYMFWYGHAGLGSTGSLCGCINGASALFGLFIANHKKCDYLVQEISAWYEESLLPVYVPENNEYGKLNPSVSGSVLCHISNNNWSKANDKISVKSDERTERCTRLAADVAVRAVQILNREFHFNNACPVTKASDVNKTCIDCHVKSDTPDVTGRMNCSKCHPDAEKDQIHKDLNLK